MHYFNVVNVNQPIMDDISVWSGTNDCVTLKCNRWPVTFVVFFEDT